MARRAASIWRAVRRPRPIALRPYSPKLTLLPRVALPVLRPFCSLRNLRLAGCSTSGSCSSWRPAAGLAVARLLGLGRRLIRRQHRLLARLHDLALEYPHLDADHAIRRLRFREAVVDVGAQRVKRHTAFAVPLRASDLDAVQTPGAHDLDALCAEAHRVRDRAFHRAPEHDSLLKLLRNRVGDE